MPSNLLKTIRSERIIMHRFIRLFNAFVGNMNIIVYSRDVMSKLIATGPQSFLDRMNKLEHVATAEKYIKNLYRVNFFDIANAGIYMPMAPNISAGSLIVNGLMPNKSKISANRSDLSDPM